MPIYEYVCKTCDTHFDLEQRIVEDALVETTCPSCGVTRAVRKVFTPVGISFKGSGFYKTDSRGSTKKSAAAVPANSSSSDSGASSGAGSGESSSAGASSGSSGGSDSGSGGSSDSSSSKPSAPAAPAPSSSSSPST
jgi:putative FmdB family regulatory protein